MESSEFFAYFRLYSLCSLVNHSVNCYPTQIWLYVRWTLTGTSINVVLIYFFMKFEFTKITHIWANLFISFNRVEKVRFIKGNKLKLTQKELLSFYFILFFISALIWFSDSWDLKTCRQFSNIYISKTWPAGRRSFYGKRKEWYKENITSVLLQHFTRAPSITCKLGVRHISNEKMLSINSWV